MDMFHKKSPSFVLEDFFSSPHLAYNFFDVMTNYGKCWGLLTKDINNSPWQPQMSDWILFCSKAHKTLTCGYDEEEEEDGNDKEVS